MFYCPACGKLIALSDNMGGVVILRCMSRKDKEINFFSVPNSGRAWVEVNVSKTDDDDKDNVKHHKFIDIYHEFETVDVDNAAGYVVDKIMKNSSKETTEVLDNSVRLIISSVMAKLSQKEKELGRSSKECICTNEILYAHGCQCGFMDTEKDLSQYENFLS